MKTKVTFFKPSGKYYLEEEIEIPDGTDAWKARPIIEAAVAGRLTGMTAVILEAPWGFPALFRSIGEAPGPNEYSDLRAANEARQKEWDRDERITLAYRGNELAGEVGEACNVVKKLERERLGIRGSRATVQQLAEELADVVICTDLVAMAAGIDLDKAVADKFNATSEKNGLATRLWRKP